MLQNRKNASETGDDLDDLKIELDVLKDWMGIEVAKLEVKVESLDGELQRVKAAGVGRQEVTPEPSIPTHLTITRRKQSNISLSHQRVLRI